jgi:hypothetical protein
LDSQEEMEVSIDLHTLERAEQRGTNEVEIREVVRTGFVIPAKYGRLGKAKIHEFNQLWRGKLYEQKRVEVFYIAERGVIVTVTVYVFYGRWREENASPI